MMASATECHVRWMIRRDTAEVLRIERASFADPWREEQFIHWLRQRDCIGMVAECGGQVAGYEIHQLAKRHIRVWNFAVAPEFRRSGVGRAMVEKLKGKITSQHRRRLYTEVREGNLEAQLFFRACGLRCDRIEPEWFCNGEPAYRFVWRVE